MVDSRSIQAVGYDDENSALYVTFLQSGETYRYAPVERRVFEEMLAADSKGSYFNRNVRNAFQYSKL